jgi:hypothetical protein
MSDVLSTGSEAPGTLREAPGVWSDSLDSLAALVDRQRRHLAGEAAAPLDEWTPPASPLPASLLPRVMLLRGETEELAAQIQRRVTAAPDTRVSPYA